MADCGAAGSALDRTVSALASAASSHLGGDGSQQAVAAAGKAVASLLGNTAATAGGGAMSAGSMVGGGGGVLPAAPPDRLYLPGQPRQHQQQRPRLQQQQRQPAMHHSTMDEVWNGTSSVMMPPPVHHHPMMAHPPHSHPHAAAMARAQHAEQMHMANMQMNMMMMQQQQQQMMMMQQQQQQVVQSQAQNTEAKQKAASSTLANDKSKTQRKSRTRQQSPADVAESSVSSPSSALEAAAENWHDGLEEDFVSGIRQYRAAEDDVKTVGEDDEEESVLGHEGYVEGASIDQLAAAWAQAEEEARAESQQQQEDYRAQYGEDFAYDPADIAAAYADPATSVAAELDAEEVGMAPYDFSEASEPHPDEDVLRKTNYFEEGIKHFDAGNMTEAIQAFETELRHVDCDNSDAWRMLGRCHAENDQDRKAIACLERAVDRDPYSVEALLLLGTSYVNELDHPRALRNLKAWATHNPMYAGMELPSMEGASSAEAATSSPEERERMALEDAKKLLKKAIEVDPTQAADAMEALGVVCNVSREYDSAIDHFRKAIDLRPDDYQLWNKLGATLANSNRSDEALPAYHKALELKPKYARAWLNMAISHANLHNYDEAARCYLQTLSLNPAATHIWSYLRIALTCAERWDLLPLAASQNLTGFKEHFDFVQY